MTHNPAQIRRRMRERRRSLSAAEQQRASIALAQRLISDPALLRSRRIAFYLAHDGEIDPAPLIASALDQGKACYLPRLKPNPGRPGRNELWFFRYAHGDELELNRFGIREPRLIQRNRLSPMALDLVLMPLVAFDRDGNRLGMGGGYYDQTFAFVRDPNSWHRPRLIGLAHACQMAEALPRREWDLPLDGVATDQALYSFARTDTGTGGDP